MKLSLVIAITNNGLLRASLRQLLKNFASIEELKFKSDLQDCINDKYCPSLLIIDSSTLPQTPVYILEKIKLKNPQINILLIESDKIDELIRPYIYDVLKTSDSEDIISNKLKDFLKQNEQLQATEENHTLSEREKEIVQFVAKGKTNKEISDNLFISPHTVITHRKNISAKLGIRTIAGITVYAILNGLIDPDKESHLK